MTAHEEVAFRLRLASDTLATARRELDGGHWREAALFARLAIEHAAKAIFACFGAVPRTHEPGVLLGQALAAPAFPPPLLGRARLLAPILAGYGARAHVLFAYGDETNLTSPWELVTEGQARDAAGVAEETVALAAEVQRARFGQAPAPP